MLGLHVQLYDDLMYERRRIRERLNHTSWVERRSIMRILLLYEYLGTRPRGRAGVTADVQQLGE